MAVEWMLVTGSIWGITNALLKRGATALENRRKSRDQSWVGEFLRVLCTWEYILPLLINLSASLVFFAKLSSSPLSVAVPVTNAVTFAMTAVAGSALGERLRVKHTFLGLILIVIGVSLCCSNPRPDQRDKTV